MGADALVRTYEAEHDDYNAIIVKAVADRLAEAFAAGSAVARIATAPPVRLAGGIFKSAIAQKL